MRVDRGSASIPHKEAYTRFRRPRILDADAPNSGRIPCKSSAQAVLLGLLRPLGRCYNSTAQLQTFWAAEGHARGMAIVDNSLAAGRRLATQVVLIQAAVAVCAGLAFLVQGVPSALSAFAGGLLVVIGTGLLALRVFAQALAGPGTMVARFALGTLLKWIVVIIGFYLIVAYLKLPP